MIRLKIAGKALLGFMTLSLLGTFSPARADDNLNFFPPNMARTTFGSEVTVLATKPKDDKPILDNNQEAAQTEVKLLVDENGDPKPEEAAPELSHKERASLREDLKKKYGEPNDDPKLRVQEDAPPAFKAMAEALDGGDEELAFDYARQYVKSLQKYQKFYKRVVSMTGQVMKTDGQAEGTPWEKVPTLVEDQQIVSRRQDNKIEEMLKRAALAEPAESEEEKLSLEDPAPSKQVTNSRNRAQIRAALSAEQIKAGDKSGKVDVFFFFDPATKLSKAVATEFEHLSKFRRGDTRVSVVAVTVKTATPAELDSFKKATKATFNIKDGASLAEKFGITKPPSFALVTPGDKHVILAEGPATFEYLDELISKIQGVSKT